MKVEDFPSIIIITLVDVGGVRRSLLSLSSSLGDALSTIHSDRPGVSTCVTDGHDGDPHRCVWVELLVLGLKVTQSLCVSPLQETAHLVLLHPLHLHAPAPPFSPDSWRLTGWRCAASCEELWLLSAIGWRFWRGGRGGEGGGPQIEEPGHQVSWFW